MLNAATKDIAVPKHMRHLPIARNGYLVPAFVAEINGEWDFRVIKPGWINLCHNRKLCWLCGEPLGRFRCYAVGPMCAVNLVSSEPPSHVTCATYAALACPFMTKPRMVRNEKDMPEHAKALPGIPLARNPGVMALWVTDKPNRLLRTGTGFLFKLDPTPVEIQWWTEGREATEEEVLASIHSGLPLLRKTCQSEAENEALDEYIAAASVRIGMEI